MRIALLLGSTRVEGPPTHLGQRVGFFLTNVIRARGHECDVIDPVVEDLPMLRRPHFTYRKAPQDLENLSIRLKAADAYVMCTPEYNHAPSPALLNILNHFGASIFSFKPSAIATYSAGQWGGCRAAHGLRPVLSELGCLPVSAMVHMPRAQDAFDPDGLPLGDKDRWASYTGRTLSQLEWWGEAAKHQHSISDPHQTSPVLRSSPSQRNAPQ